MAVSNVVARVVLKAIDDTRKMQSVQVAGLTDEVRGDLERFQNYGFTSNPHPGAEAIVLYAGGIREGGVVIVVDDRRYRLKSLAPGEVAMFNDQGAQTIMKADGSIESTSPVKIKATAPECEVVASTKVRLDTPLTEVTGTLHVTGVATFDENVNCAKTVTGTVDVVGGGKSLKTHTHSGVTAGGANTGPPT